MWRGLGDVAPINWGNLPAGTINIPGLSVAQGGLYVPGLNVAQAAKGVYLTSAQIKSLQTALNKLPSNLPRLAVDGNAGAKTTARIVEFQRMNGLTATGIADLAAYTQIVQAAAFGGGSAGGSINSNNSNNSTNANDIYAAPPPPSGTDWSKYIPLALLALVIVWVMDS